jgi:hypothetical protein
LATGCLQRLGAALAPGISAEGAVVCAEGIAMSLIAEIFIGCLWRARSIRLES